MATYTSIADYITHLRKRVVEAANTACEQTAKEIVLQYAKVVTQWDHKPAFLARHQAQIIGVVGWEVYTTGEQLNVNIWDWTDKGTKPHIIRPKKPGGRLAFRTEYQPYTLYKAKSGQGDGKAHGEWRTPQVVLHPGTEAREFTQQFIEDGEPRLMGLFIEQLRKG